MRACLATIGIAAIFAAQLTSPAAAYADGEAKRGEAIFKQRCAACHAASASDKSPKAGPNLGGIVGLPAGKRPGARYSRALASATFRWDRAKLDAYLENPRKLVPGTAMAVSLTDPASRAAVISYLRDRK